MKDERGRRERTEERRVMRECVVIRKDRQRRDGSHEGMGIVEVERGKVEWW
jgi:hypothetical protein